MAREAKEMVAVRLDPAARRKIKVLADRLKVNESEILRYAIDVTLEKLSPLCDLVREGAELVSAFVEHGLELGRAFDLDVARLDAILNGDLEDESKRVSREDIRMILGGNVTDGYVEWLQKLGSGELKPSAWQMSPSAYLHEKYVLPTETDRKWEEHVGRDEHEKRLSR